MKTESWAGEMKTKQAVFTHIVSIGGLKEAVTM